MFTLDNLDSPHFLVTWTLSCEKNNASRPDGEVFRCTTNSISVGSSTET